MTVLISVLALIVSTFSLWFTQYKSDRREIERWRRDELLRSTNEFLRLSIERQTVILNEVTRLEDRTYAPPSSSLHTLAAVQSMEAIAEQLLLIDAKVARAAAKVADAHAAAENASQKLDGGNPYDEVAASAVDKSKLQILHNQLRATFQTSVGVNIR